MFWRRLITTWLCLVMVLLGASPASAASSAQAKPHQGSAELSAALHIWLEAHASAGVHTGNRCLSGAVTSDVPHAARGALAARGFELADGAAQGAGFGSFGAFKNAVGAAGENMHWHHMVEQTPRNLARFGPEAVHNTGNLVRLDAGMHRQVSGFYSSIQPQVTGSAEVTVRQWLGTQSFGAQQEFGQQVLIRFGVGF